MESKITNVTVQLHKCLDGMLDHFIQLIKLLANTGKGRYSSINRDEKEGYNARGDGTDYTNGSSYMSKPKKMVGPIEEMKHAHFFDVERQDAAWNVLGELTGLAAEPLT